MTGLDPLQAWLDSFVADPAFLGRYPYYAAVLARMQPVADPSVDSMAVSFHAPKFYLHVNVDYFVRAPQFVRGILLHEVHHVVLGHLTHPKFFSVEHPPLMELAMEVSANEHVEEPLPNPITLRTLEKAWGSAQGLRGGQSTMERYEKLVAPSAELKEIAKPGPAIPSTFAAMVRFGRPDPTGATVPPGSKYTNEIAANLKLTVVHAQDANGGGVFLGTLKEQFAAAYAQADDLLTKNCDKLCVTLLRPILLDPLTITERPAIQGVDPKKVESPVTPGSNRPVWDRKKDIPKWPPHGGPR